MNELTSLRKNLEATITSIGKDAWHLSVLQNKVGANIIPTLIIKPMEVRAWLGQLAGYEAAIDDWRLWHGGSYPDSLNAFKESLKVCQVPKFWARIIARIRSLRKSDTDAVMFRADLNAYAFKNCALNACFRTLTLREFDEASLWQSFLAIILPFFEEEGAKALLEAGLSPVDTMPGVMIQPCWPGKIAGRCTFFDKATVDNDVEQWATIHWSEQNAAHLEQNNVDLHHNHKLSFRIGLDPASFEIVEDLKPYLPQLMEWIYDACHCLKGLSSIEWLWDGDLLWLLDAKSMDGQVCLSLSSDEKFYGDNTFTLLSAVKPFLKKRFSSQCSNLTESLFCDGETFWKPLEKWAGRLSSGLIQGFSPGNNHFSLKQLLLRQWYRVLHGDVHAILASLNYGYSVQIMGEDPREALLLLQTKSLGKIAPSLLASLENDWKNLEKKMLGNKWQAFMLTGQNAVFMGSCRDHFDGYKKDVGDVAFDCFIQAREVASDYVLNQTKVFLLKRILIKTLNELWRVLGLPSKQFSHLFLWQPAGSAEGFNRELNDFVSLLKKDEHREEFLQKLSVALDMDQALICGGVLKEKHAVLWHRFLFSYAYISYFWELTHPSIADFPPQLSKLISCKLAMHCVDGDLNIGVEVRRAAKENALLSFRQALDAQSVEGMTAIVEGLIRLVERLISIDSEQFFVSGKYFQPLKNHLWQISTEMTKNGQLRNRSDCYVLRANELLSSIQGGGIYWGFLVGKRLEVKDIHIASKDTEDKWILDTEGLDIKSINALEHLLYGMPWKSQLGISDDEMAFLLSSCDVFWKEDLIETVHTDNFTRVKALRSGAEASENYIDNNIIGNEPSNEGLYFKEPSSVIVTSNYMDETT
ncbi:MAG: hypothetical protein R3B45_14025 [Bdellovibrionota bacterium]